MRNFLASSLMEMLTECLTSRAGMGVAMSAVAMAWASLKNMAKSEGFEAEVYFQSEVKFFEDGYAG